MLRGTTPTFTFEVEGVDLTGWDVYVSFSQGDYTFTRKDAVIETAEYGCTVAVELTQKETLGFEADRSAKTQIRAYKEGSVVGTKEFKFNPDEIILDGELPQEVSNDEHD